MSPYIETLVALGGGGLFASLAVFLRCHYHHKEVAAIMNAAILLGASFDAAEALGQVRLESSEGKVLRASQTVVMAARPASEAAPTSPTPLRSQELEDAGVRRDQRARSHD